MTDLRISDLHVAETFGGLMSYDKDFDLQAYAVGMANRRLERMWGSNRPHLLIPPDPKKVPRYTASVWVVGPERDPEDHGTQLFVTWFAEEIPENFLWSVRARIDQHGGWDANAKGFQY